MLTNFEAYKDITKESYEATAKAFADKVAHLAPIHSIKRFVAMLPPKAKILDIGCGSGRDAKLLSDLNLQVCGIDFCSNLLNLAKAHAPLAQFHQMDIEAIHFSVSEFDGAWAGCSLGHLPKKLFPAALSQIYSLLKEKGIFYMTLKKGADEGLEVDRRFPGEHRKYWSYFNENELQEFVESAGFKLLELTTVEKNDAYQTHPALKLFCQKTVT